MKPATPSAPLNDAEIIDNLSREETHRRRAEEELFRRFDYFVREGAHRYKFSEEEAIDVYSDTILSAIERIRTGTFEGRSSLKTYLFRIFHNKCVDHVRKITTNKNKVHRTAALPELLEHLSDSAKTIVQKLVDRSDFDRLKSKLKELGDNCRKLLELFADGYSDKEIAVSMDYKTAEVVKTSRLRCLEKLRQSYNLLS